MEPRPFNLPPVLSHYRLQAVRAGGQGRVRVERDPRLDLARWNQGGLRGRWKAAVYLLNFDRQQTAILAQALDPATKRPRGRPLPVFEPDPGFRLPSPIRVGLSLSRDRLVFAMSQAKSNLWKIE